MKIYDASGFNTSLTGSFSGSLTGIASHAITASYALNAGGGAGAGFPFSGSGEITGSLFVSGGNISGSFVGDGSGLTGIRVEQSTITSASFTNVTEYTASHNFNTKQVLVSTYFNDDTLFFPQEIKILNDSNVTLKFNTETSGRVVIAKAGHLISGSFAADQATVVESFTAQTTVNVLHGFGSKNVITQVYEGDSVINPESITTVDSNNVLVTFGSPRTGRVVVAKGGHKVIGATVISENTVVDTFTSQSVIVTSHNFGTKNVIAQVYLDDDSQILPASLVTTDGNTVTTTLDQARSGRVVVGKAGHIISSSVQAIVNYNNIENLPTLISSSAQITLVDSASYAVTSSYASSIPNTITGSLSTQVDNQNANSGSLSFWQGTQAEYDIISSSADPNTVYFVK